MKPCPEAPATHYRLSAETWDLIVEEYDNGATAKEVAAKWKTSPGSVYRHAAARNAGKRTVGDDRARRHARMVEEEEAAAATMHPSGSRALKGLFAPVSESGPEALDPAILKTIAMMAAGRAMVGRLWVEAKALTGLAEAFSRLEARAERAALTLDTAPLWLIAEAAAHPDRIPCDRLNYAVIREEDRHGPEEEARAYYWAGRRAWLKRNDEVKQAEYRRGYEAGLKAAEKARGAG